MNRINNNKGFTMIELIVTILLLSIISIISFVAINGVIKKNKVSNCETLVNNIKIAAKEYVSDHRYDYPANDKINLSVNVLITNNYLSGRIIDPFDSSKDITDSVYVDIILNSDNTVGEITVKGIDCTDS